MIHSNSINNNRNRSRPNSVEVKLQHNSNRSASYYIMMLLSIVAIMGFYTNVTSSSDLSVLTRLPIGQYVDSTSLLQSQSQSQSQSQLMSINHQKKSSINILIAVESDQMVREAEQTLKSILMNQPNPFGLPLEIYFILDDNAALGFIDLFENKWQSFFQKRVWNVPITFHILNIEATVPDLKILVSKELNDLVTGSENDGTFRHTFGTMYRLFADIILPHEITTVIYMDTDVLLFNNVQAFWESLESDKYHMQMGIPPYEGKKLHNNAGDNAGVMAFNIEKIREREEQESLIQILKKALTSQVRKGLKLTGGDFKDRDDRHSAFCMFIKDFNSHYDETKTTPLQHCKFFDDQRALNHLRKEEPSLFGDLEMRYGITHAAFAKKFNNTEDILKVFPDPGLFHFNGAILPGVGLEDRPYWETFNMLFNNHKKRHYEYQPWMNIMNYYVNFPLEWVLRNAEADCSVMQECHLLKLTVQLVNFEDVQKSSSSKKNNNMKKIIYTNDERYPNYPPGNFTSTMEVNIPY